MFSSVEFQRFKALNLSHVIRVLEIEDRRNSRQGVESNKRAQRLAKIHIILRSMYLNLPANERESYGHPQSPFVTRYVISTLFLDLSIDRGGLLVVIMGI